MGASHGLILLVIGVLIGVWGMLVGCSFPICNYEMYDNSLDGEVQKVLNDVEKTTPESCMYFTKNDPNNPVVWGHGSCDPYAISSQGCTKCLIRLEDEIKKYCGKSKGAQNTDVNCMIQYEFHKLP